MVTGEWLDSWTGVIFCTFFSWAKESAKRARSARQARREGAEIFFRAFPSSACLALHAFLLRSPKKANKIAPVLRASEWYPFLTCSGESLCIKGDTKCGVLSVDKKNGTFTFHYFRWKGFRRERTIGKTSAYAGPYVCVCEIVENGEKC